MYAEFVNPAHLVQPQQTQTGAPLLPVAPVNPANVTPLFDLPDNGSKLQDKEPDSSSKYDITETPEESEPEGAPLFQLMAPPNFYELLHSFLVNGLGQIVELRDRLRQELGIQPLGFATAATRHSPLIPPLREHRYTGATRFFASPPGSRFQGDM